MKENTTSWKRPEDFKSFRTSDPKEMVGKYLASRVIKTWTEDFIDEHTGEVVSIERHEVLHKKGIKLTPEKVQEIMFNIQAEEIKDVEIADQKFIHIERLILPSWSNYIVVLYAQQTRYPVVVRAQNIETAIKVAIDFVNVYRKPIGDYVTPTRVNPLGCAIVDDDDDCIPESERKPLEEEKTYFKVTSRLTYISDSKIMKQDNTYMITSDEVGQAKERIYRLGQKLFKDELEDPRSSFQVRKVTPLNIFALVPKSYSEMYKMKPTI